MAAETKVNAPLVEIVANALLFAFACDSKKNMRWMRDLSDKKYEDLLDQARERVGGDRESLAESICVVLQGIHDSELMQDFRDETDDR